MIGYAHGRMKRAQCPTLYRGASFVLGHRASAALYSGGWTAVAPICWHQQAHRRAHVSCRAEGKLSVIRRIQNDLAVRQRSAKEITQTYVDTLLRTEPQIHSFLALSCEQALEQAEAVDARLAAGEVLPALAGVPVAIKDTICTAGLTTTAGSAVLEDYVPSFDATSVARLRASGALILGKANCDQFAMGSTSETSSFQRTRNPWDVNRVPGGSSGGSASCVAARQCAASLGSDTGGSIRQPAHFCGVVGIKPTYGRVSRYGLIAYGSSLDCIGPMATTVEDAAILLSSISGCDPADATSAQQPVPDFAEGLLPASEMPSRPLEGKRIGVIRQTMGEGVAAGVHDAVQAALQHLEQLGATVTEASLPAFEMGLPAYYVLAFSEASSNLSRYDGMRYGLQQKESDLRTTYDSTRSSLGAEVKRRILMGTYALSSGYYNAYYQRAQKVRTLVQRELVSAMEEFDALISPVAPSAAWRVGEVIDDPLTMYKGDIMTVNLNLAGLPAIAVPCGYETSPDGKQLPVGMQIIGRAFGEADMIKIAHAFEQTADFAGGPPPF